MVLVPGMICLQKELEKKQGERITRSLTLHTQIQCQVLQTSVRDEMRFDADS